MSLAQKKTTLLALQEAEAAKRLEQTLTVLAQPHRQGDTSELRESVFGRFVLQHKCGRECYEAGKEYLILVMRWRMARGVTVPKWVREEYGGSGGDDMQNPDEFREIVEGWAKNIKDCESAMRGAGRWQGMKAANSLILDDREVWADMLHPVKRAIHALAIELQRFPY